MKKRKKMQKDSLQVVRHSFLVANIVSTSKALVTTKFVSSTPDSNSTPKFDVSSARRQTAANPDGEKRRHKRRTKRKRELLIYIYIYTPLIRWPVGTRISSSANSGCGSARCRKTGHSYVGRVFCSTVLFFLSYYSSLFFSFSLLFSA